MGRKQSREFQVGDYWLSKRSGSEVWYRTWFDNTSRQTRRASLGTEDLETAKEKLTDWFIQNQTPVQQEIEDVTLAEVLSRYYSQHAETLPSAERTRHSLKLWLEFFGEATVSDLHNIARQEAFQNWLRGRKQSAGSIARILTSGKAAINRAWKRGEIRSVPFIQTVEVKNAPPKGRPLEVSEIITLIENASPHLRDFIFWMLGTGARPDAILDLTWRQVDKEYGIIQLNPAGRRQTKKYRPSVRLPTNLLDLVNADELSSHVVQYEGRPVRAIRTAWRRTRAKAGLDDQVQPYSLRHTLARWLRMQGVPVWEVAAQLGHSIQNYSITERYAPYDPSYLRASTAAIEAILADLRVSCVPPASGQNNLSH